jgi:outer membrane protein TolC
MLNRIVKAGSGVLAFLCLVASVAAQDLSLADMIDEALRNNPDICASQARIDAARYRIPQAKSLPDPMLMFGYQNEGFNRYTYGEMEGAQWMFSASQQIFFPGKRALKGEMAVRDAESLEVMHELLKLKIAARIQELYFDLFYAYKNIDLLTGKRDLLVKIEALTLSRYSTAKAMQQEVLMAQTEKYMLMEKEEMFRQKIQSIEAMLGAVLGRKQGTFFGRPMDPAYRPFLTDADQAVKMALEHSPEITSRNKMIDAAQVKLRMAEREYYPDFEVNASYFNRSGDFKDMWSATTTINIPLYYKTKQEPAVLEAKAALAQAQGELEAVKLMIAAAVRDNLAMIRSADRLMDLYKGALIPRNAQEVELALSGYATGRTEAAFVISQVKTLLDYETLYWGQFTERGKAIARLHAITAATVGGEKK